MSLATPLEPSGASRAMEAAVHTPAPTHERVHSLLFGRIGCAVASSCGSLHSVNEDAHSALDVGGPLFVVADGVGGGAMATFASRQLVSLLHTHLDGQRLGPDEVRAAMLAADRVIAARIAESTRQPGAATVALCAPINAFASRWLVAWVGDCRVYECRAGAELPVHALTRDDTFAHLGETPTPGGSPDDPARMVGNGAVARANVLFADLAPGDGLLLCSDGVHKFVAPSEWAQWLKRPASLLQHCHELVGLARANGSTDDATALLVRREPLPSPRARWLRALVHPHRTPR
jgi:serine/threonine protein phosphatase PrpC